jgi:hypothetical protein
VITRKKMKKDVNRMKKDWKSNALYKIAFQFVFIQSEICL